MRWTLRLLPLWTRREVRAQYRQSALDVGWALLTPVVTVVGFGFVLTQAFGVTGDGVPYVSFAWAGVTLWTFVANGLTRGAYSLVWAADLVRKAAFPKEVVPLAMVLASGLDALVGLAVLLVLMAVQGIPIGITAVAAVPVILAALVWTSAVAIILATLTAFVRDVAHGLGVVLRIGIFVTPVMYPASQLPNRLGWLVTTNPVAVFIESLRASLLYGRWPDWTLLGVHGALGVVLLVAGFVYIGRVEGRIADVI